MGTKPVYLRRCVPVHNVALLILESPGDNDENVAFANPDPFLNLSFNTPKSCHPIRASYSDVIGTKHEFCLGKLFFSSFLRQAYPDDAAILGYVLTIIFYASQNIYLCKVSIYWL